MLEWELSKHSGGDSESITEMPFVAEDSVHVLSTPEPVMAGLEQNGQIDMHMMSDICIGQMAEISTRCPPWPTITEMGDASAIVVSTGSVETDCGLKSAGMSLDMTMDEQMGLSSVNPTTAADVEISQLMLADLDDVYFDRAHDICPMVHKRRYFAWASESQPSPARACLRSAMRTLAAAMSVPYRGLVGMLYAETCRLLGESRKAGNAEMGWVTAYDNSAIEYIQAWLLVAHYECLRTNEEQAMLTAGRAFRLVQMAQLHNMDDGDGAKTDIGESFAEIEEKRRTFWVAYNLDCFLCWHKGWPLTLYEDMVGTRLPAPEVQFQENKGVQMASLAEALASGESLPLSLSPFAECAVLATLHSRCRAQQRVAARDGDARGFMGRHEWLAGVVDRHVRLLDRGEGEGETWNRVPSLERDPMLFFAHMLAHSAVVCLGTIIQTTACHSQAAIYEQRAARAAADMARLVHALPSLSCFKAHPFLPKPLATAITFFQAQSAPTKDGSAACRALLRVLRDLRDVNSLAFDFCLSHVV